MKVAKSAAIETLNNIDIPEIISLPDIVIFFDEHSERGNMPVINQGNIKETDYRCMTAKNYLKFVKDLRCPYIIEMDTDKNSYC